MDIKILIQALDRPWFITESAAHHYAELLQQVLSNEIEISAGLFGNNDQPFRSSATGQKETNGPVMVIPVNGPMMKNDFCGSPGTASMSDMIRQANANPGIKSIVLSFDSPGGSVDGTEEFASIIANSKKPVVSHGSLIGSAAYWAASQSKEIFLSGKTAIAGSIGTMAMITDVRGMKEKAGVKDVMITATRSTDKNKAYTDALDGKPEAYRKEILDPMQNAFESSVLKARAGKVDLGKEDVATGKLYVGKAGIKAGLADKIGSLETAIKRSYQLATQNSNMENNTAFQKTIAASKSDGFEVVEGGFLVQESDLTNIEAVIGNNEAAIASLQGLVDEQSLLEQQAMAELATANATIVDLNAQIEALKKSPAKNAEMTVTDADSIGGGTGSVKSEITIEAERLRAIRDGKK